MTETNLNNLQELVSSEAYKEFQRDQLGQLFHCADNPVLRDALTEAFDFLLEKHIDATRRFFQPLLKILDPLLSNGDKDLANHILAKALKEIQSEAFAASVKKYMSRKDYFTEKNVFAAMIRHMLSFYKRKVRMAHLFFPDDARLKANIAKSLSYEKGSVEDSELQAVFTYLGEAGLRVEARGLNMAFLRLIDHKKDTADSITRDLAMFLNSSPLIRETAQKHDFYLGSAYELTFLSLDEIRKKSPAELKTIGDSLRRAELQQLIETYNLQRIKAILDGKSQAYATAEEKLLYKTISMHFYDDIMSMDRDEDPLKDELFAVYTQQIAKGPAKLEIERLGLPSSKTGDQYCIIRGAKNADEAEVIALAAQGCMSKLGSHVSNKSIERLRDATLAGRMHLLIKKSALIEIDPDTKQDRLDTHGNPIMKEITVDLEVEGVMFLNPIGYIVAGDDAHELVALQGVGVLGMGDQMTYAQIMRFLNTTKRDISKDDIDAYKRLFPAEKIEFDRRNPFDFDTDDPVAVKKAMARAIALTRYMKSFFERAVKGEFGLVARSAKSFHGKTFEREPFNFLRTDMEIDEELLVKLRQPLFNLGFSIEEHNPNLIRAFLKTMDCIYMLNPDRDEYTKSFEVIMAYISKKFSDDFPIFFRCLFDNPIYLSAQAA